MYTIEVCNRRLASRPLETPKMIPSMIQLCCKNLPPRLFGTSPSSCCSLSCCWTEVHANNTQKTGWPQSSTDFPTTVKLLLCPTDFLLKIWAVQQFNKSSLLERDANYWKSLCLSNFYETKILYIIQLENKSQTVQHFVGSPGGFLCCVRTETRLISRDLTARLKLAEPLTALLLRRSSKQRRRAAKSYSSIFLPALMCKLYSL